MTVLFYLIAILPIWYEAACITSPKRVNDFFRRKKNTVYELYDPTQRSIMYCMVGYFLWTFIGLISSQWISFVILLLIGLIPCNTVFLRVLNSTLSLLVLLFILINKFHLGINLMNLL